MRCGSNTNNVSVLLSSPPAPPPSYIFCFILRRERGGKRFCIPVKKNQRQHKPSFIFVRVSAFGRFWVFCWQLKRLQELGVVGLFLGCLSLESCSWLSSGGLKSFLNFQFFSACPSKEKRRNVPASTKKNPAKKLSRKLLGRVCPPLIPVGAKALGDLSPPSG